MPDVENLLGQVTLQEKVALLAGTNEWYTVPVERLGIPSLKMTDGPNGARGAGGFFAGVKAACFPEYPANHTSAMIEWLGEMLKSAFPYDVERQGNSGVVSMRAQ